MPKQKSARGQHSADSRFGFAKPVFQPQTAALPAAPVTQTKLKDGEPNDEFEQGVDGVAEAVTRMSDPQRTDDAGMAPHEYHAARRASRAAISQLAAPTPSPGYDVPPIVHEVLRSPGQPLDPAMRAFIEPRFGHDFSQVRVHTDTRAAESARAVNARAYTVGRDVVFSEGGYTPHLRQGSLLLAHELAHVVQQERGGSSPPPLRGGILEQSADAAASTFVADRGPIHVRGASAVGLARQPLPRTEPQSLKVSLFALTDADLEEEIQLIQEWLNTHPAGSFDRAHLLSELDRLEASRWRRMERARKRQTYLEDLARVVQAVDEGRIPKWMKVFPFRPSRGPFRLDVAPIFAWREGDSIVVHQPQNSVANTDRFKKDVRTLPGDVFLKSGHALRPNELVGVRLYDEGEKVAVCYATDLLEFSEASHTAMLVNIAAAGLSVVGGPLVGRLVGRALAGLAKPLGVAAQRGLFYTKLSIGSAEAGAAGAAPTALGGIASRTSVTLVEGRATAAFAQQAIRQSTVRTGAQTAAVQSTTRTGTHTAVQSATRVSPSLTAPVGTVGGIASIQVAGAAMPQLAPIPGAQEVRVTPQQYQAAQGHTFPSHSLDFAYSLADSIGQQAAQLALTNPRFVAAVQNGNMTLAGTFFHSAAATVARGLPAAALPAGWTLQAEFTIQAGRGGSRADVLLSGPNGEIFEFDWKTRGRSALSTGSRSEMQRHAAQITANIGGNLTRQESRSWIDFVRALWPNAPWP